MHWPFTCGLRTDGGRQYALWSMDRSGQEVPRLLLGSRIGTYNPPPSLYAGTRPPKNGINAWLSVCGRFEVKIIAAPASSLSLPVGPSKSETRRAIAGAGSIQSTGQGASLMSQASSSG